MKNLIVFFALGFLISCGNHSSIDSSADKEENIESSKNTNDINYKIIKEEKNQALKKVNITIRLNKEINEEKLKSLALKLKKERPEFEKLWISYLLPEHEDGKGAWATTHFTPKLEVKILGATKESSDELNNKKVTGNILSVWKDNDAMFPNKIHLVEENNKLYMKTVYAKNSYANATEIVKEVNKNEKNGLIRYDYNNTHGEYFIVEKSIIVNNKGKSSFL